MQIRIYIDVADDDRDASVAQIDEYLSTIGKIARSESAPYWKIPELQEEVRDFVPRTGIDQALNDIMDFLGTGWMKSEMGASLSKLADGAFKFQGI